MSDLEADDCRIYKHGALWLRGTGASELEGKERKHFGGEEGRAFRQVSGPGQRKRIQSLSPIAVLGALIVTSWQVLEGREDAGSEKGESATPLSHISGSLLE